MELTTEGAKMDGAGFVQLQEKRHPQFSATRILQVRLNQSKGRSSQPLKASWAHKQLYHLDSQESVQASPGILW